MSWESGIIGTRRKLWRWGQWARGGLLGYPTQSITEQFKAGGRCTAGPEADPELLLLDLIIAQTSEKPKKVLIVHHCQEGTMRQKAVRLHMNKSTYWDYLEDGRWYVHIRLENFGQPAYKQSIVAVVAT
jgi:hypothetical protein